MSARRLFSPPVQMAAGLGVFGLAGYVFVALTGHTLDTDQANLAVTFYFLVNVIGPGIFAALEQVASRAATSAVSSGAALTPVVGRVFRSAAALVAVVVALLLLLAPFAVDHTLGGDWALFAEILATPVVIAVLSAVRGVLAGTQRFGAYALTLGVEGGARLVLCVALVLLGVGETWLFGLAYLGASVVATLVGLVLLPRTSVGADRAPAPMGRGLAMLAVATLLAQLLPNLAPLAVGTRLPLDSAVALAFGQAVVVARIPLLVLFPVQTMLLPSLTDAVTRGDRAFVVRRVKLVLGAVVLLGAVYALLFTLFGPWVLRTFMGTRADLGTPVTLLLALSTVVLIAAFAAQPALVALRRDNVVTLGWALGSAATLALVVLPGDPPLVASVAQTLGPALTLLVILLGLRSALRGLVGAPDTNADTAPDAANRPAPRAPGS